MPDEMNLRRRRPLQTTIAGIGLLELGLSEFANAQSAGNTNHINTRIPARVASFDAIRQVNVGALSVGYVEAGPSNGPVVILLDGPMTSTASPKSRHCSPPRVIA
ncbi:hypothetical protein OKW43_000825 [Paraburkholderia sp. WC7.3g]